jgi:DNA-binding NarL/FixJ family response regulator
MAIFLAARHNHEMAIKIILADHHGSMRQDLRSLLAGEPDLEVVAEAENGRRALKLVRELSPQVLIMDISMPDLGGIEAIKRLQAQSPGVKVIALSMHADSLFVLNALQAGACGYLLKDCASEELVKAVRMVAEHQKIYLSPGLSAAVIWDSALGK